MAITIGCDVIFEKKVTVDFKEMHRRNQVPNFIHVRRKDSHSVMTNLEPAGG